MILIGSSNEALQQRRRHVLGNGTVYWRSPFIRTEPEDGRPSPTAFLVEQEPNSTILPHFHQANQFQVVVAGGGAWASIPCGRSRCIMPTRIRSEEHTSELQSLMRTSYAVFCLKKKKRKKNTIHVSAP